MLRSVKFLDYAARHGSSVALLTAHPHRNSNAVHPDGYGQLQHLNLIRELSENRQLADISALVTIAGMFEGATMKFAVIAAVLLLTAGSASAQDAKAGENVYVDQKCAVCHAIAGKGNLKGALDDVGSRLTADEIRMWITDAKAMTAKTKAERKPPMREYKLPTDQVDALVAYLFTLKKK